LGRCRDAQPAEAAAPEDERLRRLVLRQRGTDECAYLQLRRQHEILSLFIDGSLTHSNNSETAK